MQIYQFVAAADGSRTPPFTTPSVEALRDVLAKKAETHPEILEDFILILVEDADGQPYTSRAPLLRIGTLLAALNPAETTTETTEGH